jgi:hypothetical protein
MGLNAQLQTLGDSLVAAAGVSARLSGCIDQPIAGEAHTGQSRPMSLNLQNEAALRLQRGGSRRGMLASALFGRSCRRLDSPVTREHAASVARRRVQNPR